MLLAFGLRYGALGSAAALDVLDGTGTIDICTTVSKIQARVLSRNHTWGPILAV